MQIVRPLIAIQSRGFGRGKERIPAMPAVPAWKLSDDAKLFAATFVAGFVFVSILIG